MNFIIESGLKYYTFYLDENENEIHIVVNIMSFILTIFLLLYLNAEKMSYIFLLFRRVS